MERQDKGKRALGRPEYDRDGWREAVEMIDLKSGSRRERESGLISVIQNSCKSSYVYFGK